MNQFLEGFVLQASLILALGAQNIFVLESGLKKERQFLVALVCSVCDVILIGVGVLGAASIFVKIPTLKIGFGILGVLFLVFYGVQKIYEAFKNRSNLELKSKVDNGLKQVIILSLGFSLLNPHVYLDTVVLIGGYAAKFPDIKHRVNFGLGAGSFSTLWFFGLALFARIMSPFLQNPMAMRVVGFIAGLILLGLSWKLGNDVYQWL